MTRPIPRGATNFTCSPGCWPEGQYCYCGDSGALISMRGLGATYVNTLAPDSVPGIVKVAAVAAAGVGLYLLFRKRKR